MKKDIDKRVLKEAEFILKERCTVRDASKIFKLSKSTIHKDMQERLKNLDMILHEQIQELFQKHISERHIKGGESTKLKYLRIKEG